MNQLGLRHNRRPAHTTAIRGRRPTALEMIGVLAGIRRSASGSRIRRSLCVLPVQYATIQDACALNLLRLQEDSPVLIGLYDPSEVLRYANRSFRQAYRIAPGEVIAWSGMLRRNYLNGEGARIETNDFEGWLASARSRRGKQAYRSFEVDLCDGRWFLMTEAQDSEGWMLCISSEITALRTGERGLRVERDVALRAAQTDVLTSISNRAHILQQLGERLQFLQLDRKSCGLVMMDLDHFKAVNDAYGHHSGDLVLKDFAATVAGTLRRLDGFGRMGGEEFMLLLPDTQPDQMEGIVERILSLVRQSHPLLDDPEFSYTCSAGMLMLHPGVDQATTYQLADEALYSAKKAGRDRLMWASERGPDSDKLAACADDPVVKRSTLLGATSR